MAQEKRLTLNPGEAHALKAGVFDLSEIALKQLLYRLIQGLSFKPSITRARFEEFFEDAKKYSEVRKNTQELREEIKVLTEN